MFISVPPKCRIKSTPQVRNDNSSCFPLSMHYHVLLPNIGHFLLLT